MGAEGLRVSILCLIVCSCGMSGVSKISDCFLYRHYHQSESLHEDLYQDRAGLVVALHNEIWLMTD